MTNQPPLESWLQKQELDLAVTLLDGKPSSGTHAIPLFKLPLVLLIEKNSKLKSAQELWERDKIEETLISLPTNESIYKCFQQGLSRLGVDWFTSRSKQFSFSLLGAFAFHPSSGWTQGSR